MNGTSEASSPPPRPPAPKLGSKKLKGRINSADSISIRFSSLENEEEDDDVERDGVINLENLSSEKKSRPTGLDAANKGRSAISDRAPDGPRSAPASQAPSPVSTPSGKSHRGSSPASTPSGQKAKVSPVQTSTRQKQGVTSPVRGGSTRSSNDRGFIKPDEEIIVVKEGAERSLLSGIRERFQDPLNAFMEKVEEISEETGLAEVLERRHKKLEATELLLTAEKSSVLCKEGSIEGDPKDLFIIPTKEPELGRSKPDFQDNDVFLSSAIQSSNLPDQMKTAKRASSLDIVDDFYAPPFNDAGQLSTSNSETNEQSIFKSHSADQISLHQTGSVTFESPGKAQGSDRLGLKLVKSKSKDTPGSPVSLTFSGLLSSTDDVDADDAMEAERFYDLKTDNDVTDGSGVTYSESKSEFEGGCRLSKVSSSTPTQRIVAIMVAVFAYLIVPLPTYLSGMVVGSALCASVIFFHQWLFSQPPPKEPYILPDLDTLPPLEVPEMKESKNEPGKFKGWINEISEYDPDNYHINQTQSIFVNLEGSTIRLQTPKHNIPKRAMFNETPQSASFIYQRHYNLTGARVFLLPAGLVKKRLWSKKYPICIALAKEERNLDMPVASAIDEEDPGNFVEMGTCAGEVILYLFARTGREKEEWYRRFEAAASGRPLPSRISDLLCKIEAKHTGRERLSSSEASRHSRQGSHEANITSFKHKRQGSTDSNGSDPGKEQLTPVQEQEQTILEYLAYMSKLMPAENFKKWKHSVGASDKRGAILLPRIICEPNVIWLNALIGRCFWDFLREEYWAEKMKQKIQRKLSKIHVPYFIDELTVTGIELGSEVPVIRRASKPYLDDRGLWIDMDIAYSGGFYMSLETKVNLMKFKKVPKLSDRTSKCQTKRSPVTHSEEEDSAESSTDEEPVEDNTADSPDERANHGGSGNTSKKILRIVDKITKSRYFQQATEYKYIKKAMEGVSNTRLILMVELKSLIGKLAINIPPPPTDRFWYGFRENPRLWLSARPKVGEREVSVTHVTDWIEKKLLIEFQRVFVMPNMDDVPLVLMCDHLDGLPAESAQ